MEAEQIRQHNVEDQQERREQEEKRAKRGEQRASEEDQSIDAQATEEALKQQEKIQKAQRQEAERESARQESEEKEKHERREKERAELIAAQQRIWEEQIRTALHEQCAFSWSSNFMSFDLSFRLVATPSQGAEPQLNQEEEERILPQQTGTASAVPEFPCSTLSPNQTPRHPKGITFSVSVSSLKLFSSLCTKLLPDRRCTTCMIV